MTNKDPVWKMSDGSSVSLTPAEMEGQKVFPIMSKRGEKFLNDTLGPSENFETPAPLEDIVRDVIINWVEANMAELVTTLRVAIEYERG